MTFKILGFPVFKCVKVGTKGVTGFKIVVLNLISFTITYGTQKGEHIHLSFGVYRFEAFGGLTIWS
jgi:hypothetical protein|tara:strand:+ start:1575 stop:1772 length:198 start_codon:yes stop_codon:yes gene_type:complete